MAHGRRSTIEPMPSHKNELGRLLTPTYLDDVGSRSLDDIRAMRSECQEAEVALSYLRRLVQGRLDIVHAFLDRPEGGPAPDLASVIADLPGILSAGPGRPAGPGHLPMLLSPDTEEADLTRELDAILGVDDLGTLGDRDRSQLRDLADHLGELERAISFDRRALHERIDVLQAELVERHKSGRASVDGLLS